MEKRAIVTGGNKGIGREVARQLATEGWRVLVVDLVVDTLAELEKQTNGRVTSHQADITLDGAAEKIMAVAQEQLGGLDLLVNNAGTSWVGQVADMPTDQMDRVLNVNFRAPVLLCRAAIPLLKRSENGQIINVSSLRAHLPQETIAVYSASKAAVLAFSQALARELAPQDIRVNVLSPCGTDTAMLKKPGEKVDPKLLAPASDMASLVITLTKLPKGLDISEILPHPRFSPL